MVTAMQPTRLCWLTRSDPSADPVQVVLDDLLETHRDYLPQFWR